jgi:hypothetical protein
VISPAQSKVIHAALSRLGYDDKQRTRAERLAVTARLAGVASLATTDDLTHYEARTAVLALARVDTPEQLHTLLNTGEEPQS